MLIEYQYLPLSFVVGSAADKPGVDEGVETNTNSFYIIIIIRCQWLK